MTAIENEFIQSWDYRENFFKELAFSTYGTVCDKAIAQVIAHLRERGCDKIFMAGSSLSAFVLSRALTYGLRDDQHSIVITAESKIIFNISYVMGRKVLEQFTTVNIFNDQAFYRLLNTLAEQPIN